VATNSGTQGETELDRVEQSLRRFADWAVLRPHPLLVTALRDESTVIFTVPSVWDRGRELLKPFISRIAESRAAVVVCGTPKETDVELVRARGLLSLLSAAPSDTELGLALTRGF
jgi:hypothetical protein